MGITLSQRRFATIGQGQMMRRAKTGQLVETRDASVEEVVGLIALNIRTTDWRGLENIVKINRESLKVTVEVPTDDGSADMQYHYWVRCPWSDEQDRAQFERVLSYLERELRLWARLNVEHDEFGDVRMRNSGRQPRVHERNLFHAMNLKDLDWRDTERW